MHKYVCVYMYAFDAMLVRTVKWMSTVNYSKQLGHGVRDAASQPKNSSTAWVQLEPVQTHHDVVILMSC